MVRTALIWGCLRMPQNRTPKFLLLLTSIVMPGAPTLLAQSSAESGRVQLARAEQQPLGDLGNGYYRNPIIAGDYADNSVVRVGPEYFLVHSGGQPRGMLVWHSRDRSEERRVGEECRAR